MKDFELRPRLRNPRIATALLAGAALAAAVAAYADGDVAADKTPDAKNPVIEKKAESRIKFSAFVEAGITANPNAPDSHENFGRILDDRPNEPMLNQVTLTLERALQPVPGEFDWGFKLQAGAGSDGRLVNALGTLENVNRGIIMPYVIEAYGNLHAPLGFLGKDAGVDLRFGQFVSILGAETVDPRTNYFYSHDYIFNFGTPYQHTGVLSTLHLNPTLDVYAGITRGANTSIYDNNGYAAFLGGVGLNNLLGGKLTLLATTSIGPENPREFSGVQFNGVGERVDVHRSDLRYYGDLVATYKATAKLTSVTEGIYIYDDGFDTSFYGASEVLAFAANDVVTAAIRFEAVRDSSGFYVTQYGANDDLTNLERGVSPLDKATYGGGPNGYLETTLGVQIKPSKLKFLTLRPEVRGDYSTSAHSRPFDDRSKQWSVTIGADAIIAF